MLCNNQMMVDEKNVPSTVNNCSKKLFTSAIPIEIKPLRDFWAEEMQRAEHTQNRAPASCNSSVGDEDKEDISQEREITLEFLDGMNEEKFERLVKEEKIRTPFKRRHSQTPSNNSRSNSSNSSNSSDGGDKDYVSGQKSCIHKEKKRLRHSSFTSCSSTSSYTENDSAILTRRQKQIDYGKNTMAYERYMETVPRSERTCEHPRTPNKYGKYSRRAFDGLIKIWRKQLHYYDPPSDIQIAAKAGSSSDESD